MAAPQAQDAFSFFLETILNPSHRFAIQPKESFLKIDESRDSGKIYEHASTLARARPRRRVASSRSPSLRSGISSERAPRLALVSSSSSVKVGRVHNHGIPGPRLYLKYTRTSSMGQLPYIKDTNHGSHESGQPTSSHQWAACFFAPSHT